MSSWDLLPVASAIVALLAFLGGRLGWKRANRGRGLSRWAWRGVLSLSLTISAFAFGATIATFWYTHRRPPPPTSETLFEGVNYRRLVRDEPRPLVIHVVKVDLEAEGIRFLVTPDDPSSGRALRARKTSDFLEEFDLQVAINANFFYPFSAGFLWSYYPKTGEPVDVCGVAASKGKLYSTNRWADGTLYLTANNQARIDQPDGPVENAIAGAGLLVRKGQSAVPWYDHDLYPRAAIGLDRESRTLILVVVDGKQPNYSEGNTLDEMAALMIEQGCHDAIRLDEGGSATLATEGQDGRARLLNCPINSRVPGLERPVANHLGIYARRR